MKKVTEMKRVLMVSCEGLGNGGVQAVMMICFYLLQRKDTMMMNF